MTIHKRIFCLSLIAFLCVAAFSCSAPAENTMSPAAPTGAQQSASDGTYPVEVTDFLGDTTTVESSDRIVSLSSSATQVLLALGAGGRIVGLDSYSEQYLPGVEVVGDYTGPDLERIVALEPDVVFAANKIQRDAIDQLREMGVAVIAAEPTEWNQIPESFELIGQAAGNTAGASDLSKQLDETVREVQDNAPSELLTCYYVLSYGNAGNWTSGEGSFINTMIEYAGGVPTTKGKAPSWLEYPMEDLAADDPQCIILSSDAGTIEDFVSTPGYETLGAVTNGLVFLVDADLVNEPGTSLNAGLREVSYALQAAAQRLNRAA